MTATEMLTVPTVSLVGNRPATTSLDIAEHFDKRHTDVMRSIRNLCTDLPVDVRERNFAPTFRTVAGPNNSERQEEFFTVYFDGFILLVMGYTGKKALGMKLAYIDAFNTMREELEHRNAPSGNSEQLPPSARSELKSIVDAKLSTYPASVQGKARSEIWARFNRHFRIAEYAQLPAERMAEARDYLIELEVKALKALPSTPSTPAAIEDTRIPNAIAELRKLVTHCGMVRNIVHMECHPGGVSLNLSAQEREVYYALQGLYQTAVDNMYAATHALDACLKLRAMYPVRG